MPRRRALTEAQLESLLALPVTEADLLRHWTLSEDDLVAIGRRRRNHNQLGFALQLCALRYPGRACKLVGVITPLLLLLCGHHSRAGSPDSVAGRRPRACRSAPRCARPGRAARSLCSSASAAPCSCAWPRSH